MPVSPLTTSAARATRSHSAPRSVRPARTRSSGSPAARATASARSRSAAEPVISTGASGPSSAAATAANRSTGQRFAPNAAPGCTRTGAGPPVRRARRVQAQVVGIGRDPGGLQERAPPGPLVRVRRGDRVPLRALPARPRLRAAEPDAPTRFAGRRAPGGSAGRCRAGSRRRPGRGRSTAPRSGRASAAAASTPPIRSTSGASAAVVASTSRCSGWARRSARRAGTATSRSPICSARRTRTVGRASRSSSATRHPYPVPDRPPSRTPARVRAATGWLDRPPP